MNSQFKVSKMKKSSRKHKPRKDARLMYWKGVAHNLLLFFIILFTIGAAYLLLYGLIIEPNIPRHVYGPGDLKELILLGILLLMIGFCFLLLRWINYQPLKFQWWNNLKFLASLKFDLGEYVALKRMGINYKHHKRRSKHRKPKKSI